MQFGAHALVDGEGAAPQEHRHGGADPLRLAGFGLEGTEKRIDRNGDQEERPDVEPDAERTGNGILGVVAGEIGERRAVLVEGHPEEDDDGEDEAEGDDAVLGLLGRQFDHVLAGGGRLLGVDVGVLEPGTEAEVDGHRHNQGHARDGETEVIGGRELVDVVLAEIRQVHDGDIRTGHHGLESFEGRRVLERAVEALVRQGGDVGLVDETGLGQVAVRQRGRRRRGEHGAEVDGHVEQGEAGVPLGAVFGIVVQVAGHDLEVALEQARAHGDEEQGADHHGEGEAAVGEGVGRDGQGKIAQEHHGNTCDDALSETDLVRKPSAEHRHEIDGCEENGIELAGSGGGEAELRLQEQEEDGQHRVVPEALAGVGEGQGKETFGLSFEHMESCFELSYLDKDSDFRRNPNARGRILLSIKDTTG